mmetsp:Transcript_13383/g.18931  ORF Transcript_13383/g.18931 Transcript_13383/m.18931 type:complete len:255 (+) Transcript_13383:56-820(+)
MNSAIGYNNLGITYLKVGNFQRAIRMFKKAIDLALAISAQCECETQKDEENTRIAQQSVEFDRAKEACDHYLGEDEGNDAHGTLAKIELSSDNFKSPYSVFVYQQPFTLQPPSQENNDDALNLNKDVYLASSVILYNMGLTYQLEHMAGSTYGDEPRTKCMKLYHSALEVTASFNPVNGSDLAMITNIQICCLNNMGAMLHEDGRYGNATECMENVHEVITSSPTLHDSHEFVDIEFFYMNRMVLGEPQSALAA